MAKLCSSLLICIFLTFVQSSSGIALAQNVHVSLSSLATLATTATQAQEISVTEVTEIDSYDEEKQLSKLAHMIGGKWWMSDGAYQEFAWGLGRTQIKMKRVVLENGNEKVVTEGFFYYSPDTYSIKGISTSQLDDENPQLLEYLGNISEATMEFVYRSISPDGSVKLYTETWRRIDQDTYHWVLESMDDDSARVEGVYRRKH